MLMQRLTPGTAMATVATDTVATTGPMATMVTMERDLPRLSQLPLPTQMLMLMPGTATMERGLLRLSQSQLLPLIPMLMLMPGTATMDTDTVAMDGEATTGLMATTVTTERGPLRLNLQLSQPLLLT